MSRSWSKRKVAILITLLIRYGDGSDRAVLRKAQAVYAAGHDMLADYIIYLANCTGILSDEGVDEWHYVP